MCDLCAMGRPWLHAEGASLSSLGDPLAPAEATTVLDPVAPDESSPTSPAGRTSDVRVDALLALNKWGDEPGNGVVVTFSFPDADSVWTTTYANDEPDSFKALSDVQQAGVRDALALWSAIASANWRASAGWAARRMPAGMLVDIGSTTTDLIAFRAGRVASDSRTDADRLATGELVYHGVVRTPLCALARRIAEAVA